MDLDPKGRDRGPLGPKAPCHLRRHAEGTLGERTRCTPFERAMGRELETRIRDRQANASELPGRPGAIGQQAEV
jgi:hypothetical protein